MAGAPIADPALPVVVIGSGGLLGRAVTTWLREQGREVRTVSVPWGTPQAADRLASVARDLPRTGAEVHWCAGAGIVASAGDALSREVASLETFLSHWEPTGAGNAFFLASSAGGVYAGSVGSPFTEDSVPVPLAPYGQAKLDGEAVALRFADRTGAPVLIGRFSNLYGPGQDISKPQGLISQLCRAYLDRSPLTIYVSPDTIRDYLYVDDAARMAVAGLEAVRSRGGTHTKIFASEQPASIATVIGALGKLTRHRVPVTFGGSPNAKLQVADLRFRSTAWPPSRHLARTLLPVGISATLESVAKQLHQPRNVRG